ncbi:hypothetical protein SUDANB58_02816 [Streptomyces sp. enrichment culture]|uniref:hypothetical protein n=1 Tax=Streptomyces sp. enrichment culture TaxID=1795815 RepID=UPI003F5516EE
MTGTTPTPAVAGPVRDGTGGPRARAAARFLAEDPGVRAPATALGTTGYHPRRMSSSPAGKTLPERVRRRRTSVSAADVVRGEDGPPSIGRRRTRTHDRPTRTGPPGRRRVNPGPAHGC